MSDARTTRTNIPRLATHALFGLALALAGCGVDEIGVDPPRDAWHYPLGLAAHPDGRYLFVASAGFDRAYNAGTVTVYDTVERRIVPESTIRIGLFAGDVAAARRPEDDGVHLFVGSRDEGSLYRITVEPGADPDAPLVLDATRTRDFGGRPFAGEPYSIAIDADGEGLTLTHAERGVVSRWSTAAAAWQPPPGGGEPPAFRCSISVTDFATAVARHPILDWWYVSDRFGRRIKIVAEQAEPVDVATPATACDLLQLTTITVSPIEPRGRTRGIAFDSRGTRLYVASSTDASLRVYDTTVTGSGNPANRAITAIALGGIPDLVRVAGCRPSECPLDATPLERAGGGLIYVTLFNDDRVVVVDPDTLTVIARIEVGDGPHDIAFVLDPSERLRGYVTLFNEHALAVLDLDPASATRFTHSATVK
ncbi:MAG: hypothetical protein R3F65_16560 [bacterium]